MPFLIRYPKAITCRFPQFDAIVENVDFAPTMLDFAGVKTPDYGAGQKLSNPSAWGTGKEPSDWKQEAYYRYWMHMAHHDNPGHMGIRTKTHKLIYYYGCNYDGGYQTPPGWELYDLVNDPHETRNIYDAPASRKLVLELKQRLAETRQRVGDNGSHYPECEKVVQEFWDYDKADQAKAREISHQYLERRLAELQAGKRNPFTHKGKK